MHSHSICYNCLGRGHFARECKEEIRCMFCFNYGHRARECFRRLLSRHLAWAPKRALSNTESPDATPKKAANVNTTNTSPPQPGSSLTPWACSYLTPHPPQLLTPSLLCPEPPLPFPAQLAIQSQVQWRTFLLRAMIIMMNRIMTLMLALITIPTRHILPFQMVILRKLKSL